jgi:hypothetical protein
MKLIDDDDVTMVAASTNLSIELKITYVVSELNLKMSMT